MLICCVTGRAAHAFWSCLAWILVVRRDAFAGLILSESAQSGLLKREDMMQRLVTAAFVFAFAGAAHAADPGCTWQQDDPNDEVGMSRTQTPANTLAAIQLVRTGEIHRLAHVAHQRLR